MTPLPLSREEGGAQSMPAQSSSLCECCGDEPAVRDGMCELCAIAVERLATLNTDRLVSFEEVFGESP